MAAEAAKTEDRVLSPQELARKAHTFCEKVHPYTPNTPAILVARWRLADGFLQLCQGRHTATESVQRVAVMVAAYGDEFKEEQLAMQVLLMHIGRQAVAVGEIFGRTQDDGNCDHPGIYELGQEAYSRGLRYLAILAAHLQYIMKQVHEKLIAAKTVAVDVDVEVTAELEKKGKAEPQI